MDKKQRQGTVIAIALFLIITISGVLVWMNRVGPESRIMDNSQQQANPLSAKGARIDELSKDTFHVLHIANDSKALMVMVYINDLDAPVAEYNRLFHAIEDVMFEEIKIQIESNTPTLFVIFYRGQNALGVDFANHNVIISDTIFTCNPAQLFDDATGQVLCNAEQYMAVVDYEKVGGQWWDFE